MRILVVTHDLTERNAHLMPWRTVCEVVSRSRDKGHEARLLSLGCQGAALEGRGIPAGSVSIPKEREGLEQEMKAVLEAWPCDVIVWPLVWREPGWRTRMVSRLGIPLVAYLPGGVYRLADTLYAARRIGVRAALPYIAEALWPKRRQLSRWRRQGFVQLIAMTDFTADAARKSGWDRDTVRAIPPGRESGVEVQEEAALPADFQEWRNGRPYYLFGGPPSGIRGIYELLAAFEQLAEKNREACLVCLFRSDAPLESARLERVIDGMKCRKRIYVVWESVEKALFDAYISASHGVVLPFVTVPSEIPLAIIESMRYGKPVITTMTGGTGDYVKKSGMAVALGDVDGLSASMLRLLSDSACYSDRCAATSSAYRSHPDWDEMVDEWLGCISGRVKPVHGEAR
ncbi:MAG TPA: glycosyltransferase [Gammaproteobacteria bacterium]|nr:glycosyltransferase [Gammaproteobacteria bacterium]